MSLTKIPDIDLYVLSSFLSIQECSIYLTLCKYCNNRLKHILESIRCKLYVPLKTLYLMPQKSLVKNIHINNECIQEEIEYIHYNKKYIKYKAKHKYNTHVIYDSDRVFRICNNNLYIVYFI